MKYVCSLMLLLQGTVLSAQEVKDTLFFLNGSKVIGEITRIKLGVVTFDADDANDITVQLQKLRTIAALMKVFRIETTEGRVYFGKVIPARIRGAAAVVTDRDTIELSLEKISVLYPFREAFRQRFSGNVSAGFDYTRSSGLGRLSFDGSVNYFAQKVELSFTVSGNYSITDSGLSRDREDITLKNNYYFSTTWFGTLFVKTQRNLELGLLRRYQEGLGGGNKFITTRNIYAWTRCGIVLNQENNSENERSGTLTELFGQLEFYFFRFTRPKISFNVIESFYYSLSQNGRVRNDAQFELNWEVIKDLSLSLSAYSNFDSQPATEGSRKLDLGTSFRLGFSF